MLALSSAADAVGAVRAARRVRLEAYTLGRGRLFRALEAAARAGADVSVRLEAAPYGRCGDAIALANRRLISALRRAGADARLSDPHGAPLHSKALVADGTLYLDDCNWRARDVVLRDTDPGDGAVARTKSAALGIEAGVLRSAASGSDVVVESESFGGGNAVFNALDDLARHGFAPRLIVCARELRGNPSEAAALRSLERDGVRVRVGGACEKIALAGSVAWTGSANATAEYGGTDTIDWGAATTDPAIASALRNRAEANWRSAKPLSS